MKKILHFGDLHFGSGEKYGHIDPATGMNTRFLDYCHAIDTIVKTAVSDKVDLVVFAGDAFKTRNPSMTQQREFAKRIRELTAHQIPVLIVTGNHDTPNDSGKANSLEIFKILADENLVKVSSRPELLIINGIQVATLPWITRSIAMENGDFEGLSKEEANERISRIGAELLEVLVASADVSLPLIIVAHATVSGAKFGAERDIMLGSDIVIPYTAFCDPKVSYAAIGHIHRHQTVVENHIVYSGSPERIDFGEEKEEKGFVVAEIEAGKRAEWEFVGSGARKFLTVETTANDIMAGEGELNFPSDICDAVVKLVVTGKKSEMENLNISSLEKQIAGKNPHWYQIIKKIERTDREESTGMECFEEMEPLDILKKFSEKKKLKKGETEMLLEKAGYLLKNSSSGNTSSGHGGFVPRVLTLKNFTSHGETVLDFSKFSLAVLSGENGAGKSSIIEAIIWGIWGESRAKSDDQLVRSGETDMEVNFEFAVGTEVFRILRKRSVRGSRGNGMLELHVREGVDCFVPRNDGATGQWRSISAPTMKETQDAIISLVGMSADVFASSAYLRQGNADKFSASTPAERKEVLSEILSLSIWGEMEEKAKAEKKILDTTLSVVETKKELLEQEIEKEEEVKTEKERLEKEIEADTAVIRYKRAEIEGLEASVKDFTVTKVKKDEYENRIKREKESLERMKAEKEQLGEAQEHAEGLLERENEIAKAVETLEKMATEKKALEGLKERALRVEADNASAVATKKALEEKIATADIENRRITERGEKNLAEIHERARVEKERINTRGKALKVKQAEAGEDCPTCGAGKPHQKKSPHADIEEELSALRVEFGKVSARTMQEESSAKKSMEEELARLSSSVLEAKEKLQNLVIREVPIFSQGMLDGVTEKMEVAKKVADLWVQVEVSRQRLSEIAMRKGVILSEELKALSSLDDAEQKLKELPEVNEETSEKIRSLRNALTVLEDTINRKKGTFAVYRNKLEEIASKKASLSELLDKNKSDIAERSAYDILAEACGKKGAPAMIIESVLPEIEKEANDVLEKISGGRMKVRFSSLREKKSGSKKDLEISGSQIETLDIFVEDDIGEREYEMFSGGEAFRVNFSIRIALSKILARRVGTKVRFLLIDEGFGALDDEGRSAFISAVQMVSEEFEKVLAVTHIDEIKDAFDTKIFVEKRDGVSKISII
ncbi:MAG: exonuclease subunit SbcD [Candidatus Peregrinibacteria bacterium]